MSDYVIQIVNLANGQRCEEEGYFIEDFALDTDPGGRGMLFVTGDIEQALTFVDEAAAEAFWSQQSKICPLRPDGRPNRPLTAYTVLIGPKEER